MLKYAQSRNRETINAKNAERNRQRRLKEKEMKEHAKQKSNGPESLSRVFWIEEPSDVDMASLKSTLEDPQFPLGTSPTLPYEDPTAGDVPLPRGESESLECLDAYDRFVEVRERCVQWMSIWGGITVWPESVEVIFVQALKKGVDEAKKWSWELTDHAHTGRVLLAHLQHLEGVLPSNQNQLRELWRLQFDQVVQLSKGIAMLETRVGVFNWRFFAMGGKSVDDNDLDAHESSM
ncbi:hypothetical protein BKA70DRAFT_1427683 [Coprinopsis sp. MPI-PUGE-AT-0042]|nr:hypothetical protein BKA70DRAFT_1427683 [Coprinopsis sp. MPI-PUGE-AT-0042]